LASPPLSDQYLATFMGLICENRTKYALKGGERTGSHRLVMFDMMALLKEPSSLLNVAFLFHPVATLG